MYTAMQIAHFVIDICNKTNKPVSNLELQKILYFLQIYFLKECSGKLLYVDDIQAWSHGPVIPDIYYTFSGYGGIVIRNSYDVSDITKGIQDLLGPVVMQLSELGIWKLRGMSCQNNNAWGQTYKQGTGDRKVIDITLLRENELRL